MLIALCAWAALAGACTSNRPLRKGGSDAAPPSPADSGTEAPPPERCERPGDRCCHGAGAPTCGDGVVCNVATDACVACGDRGQPCCARGCNVALACDHMLDPTFGVCTDACGMKDGDCCTKGECEDGTACSTADQTGKCKACGLPGLKCCRGDCWIGVCALTDAPRFCVQCGEKGQPCCDGGGSEISGCSDGSACDKAPGDLRGVCSADCGWEGKACCRGGGCRPELTCSASGETGVCKR
jgi:hypothetical protein